MWRMEEDCQLTLNFWTCGKSPEAQAAWYRFEKPSERASLRAEKVILFEHCGTVVIGDGGARHQDSSVHVHRLTNR